jgi:hypothetical protein
MMFTGPARRASIAPPDPLASPSALLASSAVVAPNQAYTTLSS